MSDFQKSLIAVLVAFVMALMGIAAVFIGTAFSKDGPLVSGLVLSLYSLFILGRMLLRT